MEKHMRVLPHNGGEMPAKFAKKSVVKASVKSLDRNGLKATGFEATGKSGIAKSQQNIVRYVSPLAGIVKRIKKNPQLGEKLAKDAGIVTKTGRLAKSYA